MEQPGTLPLVLPPHAPASLAQRQPACHHLPRRREMPTTVPYSLLANVSWALAKEGLGLQEEQPVHWLSAEDGEMFIQG